MTQREVQGTEWRNAVNDNFDELYTAGAGQSASATQSGTVELATDAEAITGTDTERAVTPANVTAVLAASAPIAGTYTAIADDATANTLDIDTGKATATVFLVQVYRAGVNVTNDAAISMAAGVITVADGAATYDITADDVINWIAF